MLKIKFKLILILLFVLTSSISNKVKSNLLSYSSEYEISLGDSSTVRVPGKTYVDKASGQLFIDWINVCDNSWVTNQRMMTRFINSFGVGTVSEINYSLNEEDDGSKMDYVLEIKEDAMLQQRIIGNAEIGKNLIIKFPQNEKKDLTFSNDIIFPHKFLKEIIKNFDSNNKMLVKKVYEGTIPDKFFNISVFFTDEIIKESDIELPKTIINQFRKIKMSYYQDNEQIPIFEQTLHLNKQGIASYFKYDYPDYSLVLKIKKLSQVNLDCN